MMSRDSARGILLVLAQALPTMAVVSLFPVIPQLAAQFGSVPHAAFLVPMIITLPSLGIAVFSPAAGWLADRFGRRPVFLGAMALYLVVGLAPLWLDALALVVASRAILGLAEAGIVTAANALIADYFGQGRHRWLALQSGLGAVLGTLLIALGGWLAESSWRGPFTVYVAAAPLLLLSLLFIDEPAGTVRAGSGSRAGPRAQLPWHLLLAIGLASLVASILYFVEPTQVATLFTERGLKSSALIGRIQALTSVAYIAGAYLYKRLSLRGVGLQLGLAGALIGLGMVGIGCSHTWQQAAWWATLQQLGGGMVIPILTAWAQGSVDASQRGRAMGIWGTFFFGGLFLCPNVVALLGGVVGGLSPVFWSLGLVTIALALFAWLGGRVRRS